MSWFDTVLPILMKMQQGGDSGSPGLMGGLSGVSGGGGLMGTSAGMTGGALPGTDAPSMPNASPYAGAFGGSPSAYQFSMPGAQGGMNPQMLQQAMAMMQQRNQQGQQGQPQAPAAPQAMAFGNPAVRAPSIAQPMPYTQFGGAGVQPFGFGGGNV